MSASSQRLCGHTNLDKYPRKIEKIREQNFAGSLGAQEDFFKLKKGWKSPDTIPLSKQYGSIIKTEIRFFKMAQKNAKLQLFINELSS